VKRVPNKREPAKTKENEETWGLLARPRVEKKGGQRDAQKRCPRRSEEKRKKNRHRRTCLVPTWRPMQQAGTRWRGGGDAEAPRRAPPAGTRRRSRGSGRLQLLQDKSRTTKRGESRDRAALEIKTWKNNEEAPKVKHTLIRGLIRKIPLNRIHPT